MPSLAPRWTRSALSKHMDQESNQKRMILAAALSLAVMLIWQLLFPPPPKPEPEAGETPAFAQAEGTATSSSAAVAAKLPSKPAPAPIPSVTKPVEAELFQFKGAVELDDREVPFELTLTNVGGAIEDFVLPSYMERNKDNQASTDPIRLADPTSKMQDAEKANFIQAANLRFLDKTSFSIPDRVVYEVAEKSADRVLYRYTSPEGVVVEREYKFHPDTSEVWMAVSLRNAGSSNQTYEVALSSGLEASEAMEKGSGFFASFVPPPDHLQVQCYTDGGVERDDYKSLQGSPERYTDSVRWVAIDRQYFLSALVLRDESVARCQLEGRDNTARASLIFEPGTLKPGEERRYRFSAYLGMKTKSMLTRVNANLESAVDYTFLGFDLAPLSVVLLWILGIFHALTGSWGVAIIGLTLLVKTILFPLNQRGMRSMRAMSALKPEMEKIREKFPDDKQRQNEEMMGLYRKHNVNPAGGCLPILIQMPIWVALYRSLWSSVDLYQEGFLWITDLTTRDPYWILPVTLVVAMFLQQRFTPNTMDAAQQKMMQWTMPLVFGLMMMALPAGLCLYILANTVLTIVQQHLINRSIPSSPPVQGAKA